jgi:hypothetical protein
VTAMVHPPRSPKSTRSRPTSAANRNPIKCATFCLFSNW